MRVHTIIIVIHILSLLLKILRSVSFLFFLFLHFLDIRFLCFCSCYIVLRESINSFLPHISRSLCPIFVLILLFFIILSLPFRKPSFWIWHLTWIVWIKVFRISDTFLLLFFLDLFTLIYQTLLSSLFIFFFEFFFFLLHLREDKIGLKFFPVHYNPL